MTNAGLAPLAFNTDDASGVTLENVPVQGEPLGELEIATADSDQKIGLMKEGSTPVGTKGGKLSLEFETKPLKDSPHLAAAMAGAFHAETGSVRITGALTVNAAGQVVGADFTPLAGAAGCKLYDFGNDESGVRRIVSATATELTLDPALPASHAVGPSPGIYALRRTNSDQVPAFVAEIQRGPLFQKMVGVLATGLTEEHGREAVSNRTLSFAYRDEAFGPATHTAGEYTVVPLHPSLDGRHGLGYVWYGTNLAEILNFKITIENGTKMGPLVFNADGPSDHDQDAVTCSVELSLAAFNQTSYDQFRNGFRAPMFALFGATGSDQHAWYLPDAQLSNYQPQGESGTRTSATMTLSAKIAVDPANMPFLVELYEFPAALPPA